MRVSVDLLLEEGVLVSSEYLAEVTGMCRNIFFMMGKLREVITSVDVSFARLEGRGGKPGPVFCFHLRDFGFGATWEIDYRSIGSGRPNPSAEEISEAVYESLPKYIEAHLKRCTSRLHRTQRAVEGLLQKTPSCQVEEGCPIPSRPGLERGCVDGSPCRSGMCYYEHPEGIPCRPKNGDCSGCSGRPS